MPGTYVSGIAISIIIASNVFVEGSRVNEPKNGSTAGYWRCCSESADRNPATLV